MSRPLSRNEMRPGILRVSAASFQAGRRFVGAASHRIGRGCLLALRAAAALALLSGGSAVAGERGEGDRPGGIEIYSAATGEKIPRSRLGGGGFDHESDPSFTFDFWGLLVGTYGPGTDKPFPASGVPGISFEFLQIENCATMYPVTTQCLNGSQAMNGNVAVRADFRFDPLVAVGTGASSVAYVSPDYGSLIFTGGNYEGGFPNGPGGNLYRFAGVQGYATLGPVTATGPWTSAVFGSAGTPIPELDPTKSGGVKAVTLYFTNNVKILITNAEINGGREIAAGAAAFILVSAVNPTGKPVASYRWEAVTAPAGSQLASGSASDLNNFKLYPDVEGEYRIAVTVTDTDGVTSAPYFIDFRAIGGEVHVGQVVLDPDFDGDGVVDVVNLKSGFAILRFAAPGANAGGIRLENVVASYDNFSTRPSSMTTNEMGEILVPISPFVASLASLDKPVDLKIEYDTGDGRHIKGKPIKIKIRFTFPMTVGFAEIRPCETQADGCFPALATPFTENMERSLDFIQAVYPVADHSLQGEDLGRILGSSSKSGGDKEDRNKISDLKKGHGLIDFVVGIVPFTGSSDDYFSYHGREAVGLCGIGDNVALVAEQFWSTAAHEMAHGFCVRFDHGIPVAKDCKLLGGIWHDSVSDDSLSGYNSLQSGYLDPAGRVDRKFSYLYGGHIPDEFRRNTIRYRWSGKHVYEALFVSWLANNAKANLANPGRNLILGISQGADGAFSSDYAFIQDVPGFNSHPANSGNQVVAKDISGNTLATVPLADISYSPDEGTGNQALEARQFEAAVPYGLSVARVELAFRSDSGARSNWRIVPLAEVLRTSVGFLPDSAFASDPQEAKAKLNNALTTLSNLVLDKKIVEAKNALEGFRALLNALIAPSYSPHDSVQPSLSSLLEETRTADLQLFGFPTDSGNTSNGFISVIPVPSPSPGGGTVIAGRRLTAAVEKDLEIALVAKVDGNIKVAQEFSDGTFSVGPLTGSHQVLFETYLRDKRKASTYISALRQTNGLIGELRTEIALQKDPILRARMEEQLVQSEARAGQLEEQIGAMGTKIGGDVRIDL